MGYRRNKVIKGCCVTFQLPLTSPEQSHATRQGGEEAWVSEGRSRGTAGAGGGGGRATAFIPDSRAQGTWAAWTQILPLLSRDSAGPPINIIPRWKEVPLVTGSALQRGCLPISIMHNMQQVCLHVCSQQVLPTTLYGRHCQTHFTEEKTKK